MDQHEKDPVPALSEHLAEGVSKHGSLHRVRQLPAWGYQRRIGQVYKDQSQEKGPGRHLGLQTIIHSVNIWVHVLKPDYTPKLDSSISLPETRI